MKSKKILFISSVNLSTNPRILKEMKFAQSLNYDITFLGFYLGNWSDELDKDLRKEFSRVTTVYLDATRRNFSRWLRHSLMERFNRILWRWNKRDLLLAASACNKRTFALIDYGKTVGPGDFDLVIGHTLGAFYPGLFIARRAICNCAFDMEDYHPGEHIDADIKNEVERREFILKHVLPTAFYISASSPLIGRYTKELCALDDKKLISILNFFPSAEFRAPAVRNSGKIRLIWFSQFISGGRGLETLLSVWKELENDFELTLIGSADQSFHEIVQHGIEIKKPLSQIKLHEQLGQYDIGLALDLTSRDFNRDIALTNKILAYYQAGLYILATDTAAQKEFMHQHPVSGMLFSQNDRNALLWALHRIREDITKIRSGSLERYRNSQESSWENESHKLKTVWEASLN